MLMVFVSYRGAWPARTMVPAAGGRAGKPWLIYLEELRTALWTWTWPLTQLSQVRFDLMAHRNATDAWSFNREGCHCVGKLRCLTGVLCFNQADHEGCGEHVARARRIDLLGGSSRIVTWLAVMKDGGSLFSARDDNDVYELPPGLHQAIWVRHVLLAEDQDVDTPQNGLGRVPVDERNPSLIIPTAEKTLGGYPDKHLVIETMKNAFVNFLVERAEVSNRGVPPLPRYVIAMQVACPLVEDLFPLTIHIDILKDCSLGGLVAGDLCKGQDLRHVQVGAGAGNHANAIAHALCSGRRV